MTALGLYCADQHLDDYRHDPEAFDGLLLRPVAWQEDSPVVTLREFERFVYANLANDHNGDWGRVTAHTTSDAGRCMVYIGADAWAELSMADWPAERCTLAELREVFPMVWTPGDGGLYRMHDVTGWDEFSPV